MNTPRQGTVIATFPMAGERSRLETVGSPLVGEELASLAPLGQGAGQSRVDRERDF